MRGVRIARHGATALLSWRATRGARLYKVVVDGSDGRVEVFHRKPSSRSVTVPNVLAFESFTATVTAEGGPNLLPGPGSSVRLRPLRPPAGRRPSRSHGHRRKH